MSCSLTRRVRLLLAVVLLTLTPVVAVAGPGQAAPKPLTCKARVSDSTPKQYTNVNVTVNTGQANAAVKTVAHYKTTDTTKSGKSGKKGFAVLTYYISGATAGYKVVVNVTVSNGSATRSCATSFTPHA